MNTPHKEIGKVSRISGFIHGLLCRQSALRIRILAARGLVGVLVRVIQCTSLEHNTWISTHSHTVLERQSHQSVTDFWSTLFCPLNEFGVRFVPCARILRSNFRDY